MALNISYRRLALAIESRMGARRLSEAFDRTTRRLAEFPQSAPLFEPSRSDVRAVLVGRFAVLFYTFDDRRLIVLRVLYGRQDLDAVRAALL